MVCEGVCEGGRFARDERFYGFWCDIAQAETGTAGGDDQVNMLVVDHAEDLCLDGLDVVGRDAALHIGETSGKKVFREHRTRSIA